MAPSLEDRLALGTCRSGRTDWRSKRSRSATSKVRCRARLSQPHEQTMARKSQAKSTQATPLQSNRHLDSLNPPHVHRTLSSPHSATPSMQGSLSKEGLEKHKKPHPGRTQNARTRAQQHKELKKPYPPHVQHIPYRVVAFVTANSLPSPSGWCHPTSRAGRSAPPGTLSPVACLPAEAGRKVPRGSLAGLVPGLLVLRGLGGRGGPPRMKTPGLPRGVRAASAKTPPRDSGL